MSTKTAYAIWRGSHRATQPPPHWDHLGDDAQQIATGMYEAGVLAGRDECRQLVLAMRRRYLDLKGDVAMVAEDTCGKVAIAISELGSEQTED